MAEIVLHIVTEDPEVEHVPPDVRPASVEKHRGENRNKALEIQRTASEILPKHEPRWNESVVLDELIEKGTELGLMEEDQHVGNDQGDGDEGRGPRSDGVPNGDHRYESNQLRALPPHAKAIFGLHRQSRRIYSAG